MKITTANGPLSIPPGAPALMVLTLVLMVVSSPLMRAGLFTDDWMWMALVRHLEHPFAPYYEGMLHEYFYRPTSIAFWWLSERLAGVSAQGNYGLDIVIHIGNAWLLTRLLHSYGRSMLSAVSAAALFSLMPGAFGLVLWLSNRNELLAVFFGLAFLLSLERARGPGASAWSGSGATLLLCLSLSSKESGLVFAAAGILRLLMSPRNGSQTGWRWLPIALPIAGFFLLRKLTILPVGINVTWDGIRTAAPAGILAWFETLPSALSGFASSSMAGITLLAVLGMASAIYMARALPSLRSHPDFALVFGLGLLLGPPCLQWPVTHFVLGEPTASAHLVNLRFYYLSIAGIAVLATGIHRPANRYGFRVLCALMLTGILCFSIVRSKQLAEDWRVMTVVNDAEMRSIAAQVLRRPADFYTPDCRILLRGRQWPGSFGEYADVVVKAIAPRDHPILGCAVFADEGVPWHALLPRASCSTAHWPRLTTRHPEPYPLMRPIGNLCLAGFHVPSVDAIDRTINLER